MRPAISFTAGLALGVVAGWSAAVVLRPAEVPAPETPAVAPTPTPVAKPRAERRRESPPTPAPEPAPTPEDRSAILESGDAGAIRRASFTYQPFSDAEALAASARLTRARDAGDAVAFVAVFEALGKSKDARACARIVEVLGDTSYPLASLKTGVFDDVERWLRDGDAPSGVGAAARRRIDANAAAGDVRGGVDPLLRMVARHGDADDLAWLATTTSSREIGLQTIQALATVRRAETAPIVAQLVAAGKVRGEDLVEYAKSNPGPAWELVSPMVRSLADGVAPPGKLDVRSLLEAYGNAAPSTASDEVRGRLLALGTPEHRVAAVYAVQALAGRKFDVAPFQQIVDAPIDLLAQPGPIEAARGQACMYAIQYNRVAWSLRAAETLESAAPRSGKLDQALRDVAREIRGEVAGPWRRK